MSRELKENRMALIKTTDFLKQSKKVLEEHTRFVELVLENITTGVISMDIDGRVEVSTVRPRNCCNCKPPIFQANISRKSFHRIPCGFYRK